jgi:hypothetical protein
VGDFFPFATLWLLTVDICVDPSVYPHFDIYPSVQGDRGDRSYASNVVPETSAIQTQGCTLPAASLVLRTGSSLQADLIGYPTLNICMYSPFPEFPIYSFTAVPICRCSNHCNSDPAVYPYFEIYPKVQTVQSQVKIKSDDGGWEVKSYMRSGPEEVSERQPWAFGWPWFGPVSPPSSTLSSVSTSTSSPAPKSAVSYPAINICEFFVAWDTVLNLLANPDAGRSCGLPFLQLVPRRGTVYPCSTFQTSPTAKVSERHQGVSRNETRLPCN